MRKFVIYLAFLLVSCFMLSACSAPTTSTSALVGSWNYYDEVFLEFSTDNRGTETFQGQEFTFSWSTSGDELIMEFDENSEGSPLNEILSLVIHGEAIESFAYSFEDNVLMLSDGHYGHSHFVLEFVRVE